MKRKILVILAMVFLFNIILTYSQTQDVKAIPSCSDPTKITEQCYSNTNSYLDSKFYQNSDPKKWNFRDPNFDYNKIPVNKYKELPYDNPNLDHSKLNPNKYIAAFGCPSCSFNLFKQVRYSKNGVFHPKTGFARVPTGYPPSTLFISREEGIFIVMPQKIDEKFKLDTSDIGSATIVTTLYNRNQKITLSNGAAIKGWIGFSNNHPFVPKNFELIVDGVKIKPKVDVALYFDGREHQGNYVSFEGQKKLIAAGNNFDLEFTPENKLVKVFYEPKIRELAQRDILTMSVGDGISKSGKISFINREDQNLLSLLNVKGFLRIRNDGSETTVDGTKVKQNLIQISLTEFFQDIVLDFTDAVSMQMVVEEDLKKVYTFDEKRSIKVMSIEQARKLDLLRENILKQHNVILTGFFDENSLTDFTKSLKNIKERLGIDFFAFERIKGKKLEVFEYLQIEKKYGVATAHSEEAIIRWVLDTRTRNDILTSRRYTNKELDFSEAFTHEVGHILFSDQSIVQRIIAKSAEYKMTQFSLGGSTLLPSDIISALVNRLAGRDTLLLFPTFSSLRNIDEFIGEIFYTMVHRPQWFTDPSEGLCIKNQEGADCPKLEPPVSAGVLKRRQAFREIILEELQKRYKNEQAAKK
ncbi:hypothetical protein HYX02_01960 [Candidatus Woesearchaeota archaeon]|nr:hypothetical protein [Candidatus Woesearchaeota archaeon]